MGVGVGVAADEAAVRWLPAQVWATMAGGDGQLDDQAATGLGATCRQYASQCREIILKAITHNVMILQS